MRKLFLICLLIAIPVYVLAAWQVNVTVNAGVSSDRDLFALRDSVSTTANNALDNVTIRFNPSMTSSGWNLQLEIIGFKKAGTDLDDFGVSIYNYFESKFDSGEIKVEYRNTVNL
jgi:hypothetical protein